MRAYYNGGAQEPPPLERETPMQTRPLGRTSLRASEIGFGAWGIGGTLWIGARPLREARRGRAVSTVIPGMRRAARVQENTDVSAHHAWPRNFYED